MSTRVPGGPSRRADQDASLVVERTSLAWRRTAFAHLVAALVMFRLVGSAVPRAVLALVLLAGAAVASWGAARASAQPEGRRRPIVALAALTVVAALAAARAAV